MAKPIKVFILSSLILTTMGCNPFQKEESAPAASSGGSTSGGGGSGDTGSGTTPIQQDPPDAPTSITSTFASDFDTTPEITVNGVGSGNTVKLYDDSGCTNEVASVVASGTTATLTTSALSTGAHTLYATQTDAIGASDCTSSGYTYTVATCPTNYIKVPGNSTRNVNPFCAMKFEAKNVGGVATSQAALTPWASVTAAVAKSSCKAIGANYDLMSNQEYMTIADNITEVLENHDHDSNPSTVGKWFGMGIESGGAAKDVSDESDYWDQAFSTTFYYRRANKLTNDEVIWDLAGNVFEIVDWGTAETYTLNPGCGSGTSIGTNQLKDAPDNCTGIDQDEYMPVDPTWISTQQYIGTFARFANPSVTARGGGFSSTTNAGIYAFTVTTFTSATSSTSPVFGFRCVYRP